MGGFGISSKDSSTSSCLERLDRDEENEESVGRLSFRRGADSGYGEGAGDLLDECDGTERLPDRLGSFGEGGGPIGGTLAMTVRKRGRFSRSVRRTLLNHGVTRVSDRGYTKSLNIVTTEVTKFCSLITSFEKAIN